MWTLVSLCPFQYAFVETEIMIYIFAYFYRKYFGTVLNYLRDGSVPLPEQRQELEELLAEAR